jgi:glutamate-1-semialdehyde 2,1-aminomutase
MNAGIATLEILQEEGAYARLEATSGKLADGLAHAAKKAKCPLAINRVGSMIGMFFVKEEGQSVTSFEQATACDGEAYRIFFHQMLDNGVFLAPSPFEALFVSLAHNDEAVDKTLEAAEKAFAAVTKMRTGKKPAK